MLLAALLAGSVSIASATVAGAARVRISSETDAHWRGSFDILVRPSGARLNLEATGGLVEPNFLSFAGKGGITPAQVAGIRSIPGVEIAAPVAFIGSLTTTPSAPTIHISEFPTKPTLFDVSMRVATSDGLRDLALDQTRLRALLGPPAGGGGDPLAVSDFGNALIGRDGVGAASADITTDRLLPPLTSPILAVDPSAERALLGQAGAFLDPLVAATLQEPSTARSFDLGSIPAGYDARTRIALLRMSGGKAASRPVFPVVVSSRAYATMTLTLVVDQVGRPLAAPPAGTDAASILAAAAEVAGPGSTAIGSTTRDLTGDVRPLRINSLTVEWPGSASAPGAAFFKTPTEFDARLFGRPGYVVVTPPSGSGRPSFRVEPTGVTSSRSGAATTELNGDREQTYRTTETMDVPIAHDFVPSSTGDAPFVLAPVGEFDLGTLDLPSDPLSYVPLGAYTPPSTTLIADPSGRPVEPEPMDPTLNPAGLLQMPPLVIADLSAAEALRGTASIDAVRVRVGGLKGFGPEDRAEVERVATAIAALGLDVDVVAGSSPQAVDIYVPGYDARSDPPSDLGWVEQHWTTLGAASRVERGLGDTNIALLVLALLTVAVVIFGLQILEGDSRRREAGILVAAGWTASSIVRWRVGEAVIAGLLVGTMGAAAFVIAGSDPTGLLTGVLAGVMFPLAAIAAGVRSTSPDAVTSGEVHVSGRPLRSVTNARAYAIRAVSLRRARSLATIAGLAVAAAALAPTVVLITDVGFRVGPTLLAEALSSRLQPYQLGLVALSALGSVGFVLLAFRLDHSSRRHEFDILAASGWESGDIARTLAWGRLAVALPASMLAFLAAAVLGPIVTDGSATAAVAATLAAGIALTATLWGRLADWRIDRP